MSRRRTRRSLVVLGTLLALVFLGLAAWQSRDHVDFWRRFELLGRNTQGYLEYRHRQTGMLFVRLPGGTFWMGSQSDDPAGRNYDPETDHAGGSEHTVHRVTLSPFLIGKFEVTQAQFEAIMHYNQSHFRGQYAPTGVDEGTLPVDSIYRDDLVREDGFLDRTGLHLPTEAQWEYACRGGKDGPIPGSGNLDDLAWYDHDPGPPEAVGFGAQPPPPQAKTQPVGTKEANDFGLHDVLGNVEEWVADAWNPGFYDQTDGATNPLSVRHEGVDGIFRGGSWGDSPDSCRCPRRDGWRTGESSDPTLGFRAAYYPLP